ncbi:SRPBCC family protein [Gordonia sp. CPCC 205333]|uniref:SRPBCC family protein n=1 Tax=Gordonia sp. CPCC 205333 TaxID=3140790 RepID=UPI003AF39E1D
MSRVSAQATASVKKPTAQVWAALADHAGMSAWGPGTKVNVTAAKEGDPNGVGAVRRIKVGPGPAIVEEITEFSPDQKLGYRALAGVPFKDYQGLVALTATPGGTEIVWTLTAADRLRGVESVALKVLVGVLLRLFTRSLNR